MKTWTPVLLLSLRVVVIAADLPAAPALPRPDPRYKADILIVIAHQDDDTSIGGYLARAAIDGGKRFAVVYCTNGDAGGNAKGNESGAALALVRQIEARRSLAVFGIENVWFLGAPDTPGQNVLRSLENWGHGRVLEQVVRIMRITRPEVVLTFLPAYVFGENHGDHQAAGVVATEAFDIAGDPTKFAEQVSPARDPRAVSNLLEGLRPWQPKKMYYFSDAFENFSVYWHDKEDLSPFRGNFMDGRGPSYATTEISPSRHESYARLAARQLGAYETQEGALGSQALVTNDISEFEYPIRFVFGKSVVRGGVTGDLFENVKAKPAPFARASGYQAEARRGLSLETGGPWSFYREFWKAHDVAHLASLIPVPECAVEFGGWMEMPLIIRNDTERAEEITVAPVLPQGWENKSRYARFHVEPDSAYPVDAVVAAPSGGNKGWQQITWNASAAGRPAGSVTVRVYVGKTGGQPQ